MWEKIRTFLSKKDNLFIIVLLGILMFVISIPVKKECKGDFIQGVQAGQAVTETEQIQSVSIEENAYRQELEKELEDILSKMEGVDGVRVMITLKNTQTNVYSDQDNNGGLWQQKTPMVVTTELPKVEGVLVMVERNVNGSINKDISEAVCALFGLEMHKVKVIKSKRLG